MSDKLFLQSVSVNIYRCTSSAVWLLRDWCHVKPLPSQHVLCACTMPCHFMQSHICREHVCLALTCHLHFWQNDGDLSCATVVPQEWNRYRTKSQRRKLSQSLALYTLHAWLRITFTYDVDRCHLWLKFWHHVWHYFPCTCGCVLTFTCGTDRCYLRQKFWHQVWHYSYCACERSRGTEIAQWLEHWTCGWKVTGLNPCRSGGRIFFSRVDFLCWLIFRYLFHPRVTAVARKISQSFCQKCRWQVTAKHTYTLPTWLWMKWHCKLVYGWMVYTEHAPRWQQFHMAPAMQKPKSATSTPPPWILIIRAIKGYSHSFRITCDMCAVSLLESRE